MTDLDALSAEEQVRLAMDNPSLLDTAPGFSTEALRELSMDTSWLDDELGTVDELGWFARMGRYLLTANSQGFYGSYDAGTVDAARDEWARIERVYS